jgi:hypothetical protein
MYNTNSYDFIEVIQYLLNQFSGILTSDEKVMTFVLRNDEDRESKDAECGTAVWILNRII